MKYLKLLEYEKLGIHDKLKYNELLYTKKEDELIFFHKKLLQVYMNAPHLIKEFDKIIPNKNNVKKLYNIINTN